MLQGRGGSNPSSLEPITTAMLGTLAWQRTHSVAFCGNSSEHKSSVISNAREENGKGAEGEVTASIQYIQQRQASPNTSLFSASSQTFQIH